MTVVLGPDISQVAFCLVSDSLRKWLQSYHRMEHSESRARRQAGTAAWGRRSTLTDLDQDNRSDKGLRLMAYEEIILTCS
ncbi:uncharacterized protein V6R79_001027 [Siganus canaliculatus]